MTTAKDLHVEAALLQRDIESYIGLGGNTLIYEYNDVDGSVKLDLITVNSIHRQSFLFHSVTGYDKIDALNHMLEYVKSYKEKESSFTIQWSLRGEDSLHTSYFRAKNIFTALEKLFYGRDPNTIMVFSVILNPLS